MIKCPSCELSFREVTDLMAHIEEEHPDSIPKGYSMTRYIYYIKTGKENGRCVICKDPTGWNEKTGKYHRFCKNPKCKEKYVETFRKRMIGKRGVVTMLNDPEHQRKMLANRSISGTYKWSDGKEFSYTGTYELDFLKFLDQFMEFDSADVLSPSPHTYYYMYEGKKRFYIPDFFIPSLNLEIEVKDAGEGNPKANNHPKIVAVDRVKEKLKDAVLTSQKNFSYIKVFDKQYDNFIDLLMKMKESVAKNGEPKQLFYLEDWNSVHFKGLSESYKETITEAYISYLNGSDATVLESSIDALKDNENEHYQNELITLMENSLHVINTYDYILEKVKEYDENLKLDNIHKPKLGFEIVYPGFADMDFYHCVRELMETGDQTTFRKRITKRAKSLQCTKEQLIRDLEVCKFVMKNHADHYPETTDMMNENYCWLDNVINEQVLTIGGDEMYPVYVVLTHTGTVLSNIIKGVTKKEYSHASISFDSDLNKMYSFGRKYKSNPLIGTFVREDINSGLYKDVKDKASYSVYVTFVTAEQRQLMLDRLAFFNTPGKSFKYNFIGLINYAMGKETAREEAFFCSQFVDTILSSGKQFFDRHSSLIEPSDFAEHSDFHFVSKGLLKDYDSVYTNKKTELIASSIKVIKPNPHKVVYIPISLEQIKDGKITFLNGGKISLPTTYKDMKNELKTHSLDSEYTHYMVVPIEKLTVYNNSRKNNYVVVATPLTLKITNKNLI